jgi:hypothetical protein
VVRQCWFASHEQPQDTRIDRLRADDMGVGHPTFIQAHTYCIQLGPMQSPALP